VVRRGRRVPDGAHYLRHIVGEGKRLFREGCAPGTLSLVDSTVPSAGALAHTFRPAGPLGTGNFLVEDGKEAVQG
jgi:hypothetical protein